MLNKVMIIGRLGREPELRYTQGGTPVATCNFATDETYTDQSGEKQKKTEWHRITVWGKQAELCGQYLQRGSLAFVEGKLQTRKWQDQQGQKRYTTEIWANRVQFLDPKGRDKRQDVIEPNADLGPAFPQDDLMESRHAHLRRNTD